MRDCVEGEGEARVDDLIIGLGHYVGLTCGELRSALMYTWTHVHAERPVDSVKDYAIFSFDSGIGGL